LSRHCAVPRSADRDPGTEGLGELARSGGFRQVPDQASPGGDAIRRAGRLIQGWLAPPGVRMLVLLARNVDEPWRDFRNLPSSTIGGSGRGSHRQRASRTLGHPDTAGPSSIAHRSAAQRLTRQWE